MAFEKRTREPQPWQNSPPFFDGAYSPVKDGPQRPSDGSGADSLAVPPSEASFHTAQTSDSSSVPPSEASFHTAQTSGSSFSIGGFSTVFANAPDQASPWRSYLRRRNLIPGAFYEQNWSGRGQHAEFGRQEQLPFTDDKLLGQAGTARVDSVTCQRIRLARKTIRCRRPHNREEMAQEVAHLQRLRHAHIIRMIGTYVVQSCNDLHILLYPVAQYNLESFMDEIRKLSADNEDHPETQQEKSAMFVSEAIRSLVSFFHCLTSTLSYLHRQEEQVTKHMDIKPANILVRDMSKSTIRHLTRFKVYLADFGIARSYRSALDAETDSPTSFTKVYAAPEVHAADTPRGLKADVFSLGCVFAEILCTYLSPALWDNLADIREANKEDPSFQANSEEIKRYLKDIEEHPPVTYYSLEARCYCSVHAEACIRMLDADPERRPSADTLMQDLAIWDRSQTVCCDRGRDELEAADKTPIQSSVVSKPSTERDYEDGKVSENITDRTVPIDLLDGVQKTQTAATLTNNYPLDWPVANFSAIPASSLKHENLTVMTVKIQYDEPGLNSLQAVGSNTKSGSYNNNQFPNPQAWKAPFRQSYGFSNDLTSSSMPNHTSEINQPSPGIENANLGVIPEDSPSDFMTTPGSTGKSWSAIESSELDSSFGFVSITSPMTAGSEMNSPSYEQISVSEPGAARTVPKPTSPAADNGPEVSILPAAHANSATLDWAPKAATGKRKREEAEESREEAKRVRKVGACVRCHMYKLKCDDGTPCQKCRRDETIHRLFFQPCSRQDILDVIIVRHGNAKFGQKRASFRNYHWNNVLLKPKAIQIRWSLPENIQIAIPSFTVPCTAFDPSHGDITVEQWQVGGQVTTVELPPVACAEEYELIETIVEMVERNREVVEEETLQSITDTLARRTFEEAYRYAWKYDSKTIMLALRISSTAIFSQGWGSIVGAETLDTQEIENAADGYCGRRPIPPALYHQIDVMFLKMMESDEQTLVKELKMAFFRKNPKPWYEMFLACFVILWHLKFIHGQAMGFMRSRKQTEAEGKVCILVRSMIEEWENSARTMIYHLRYVLQALSPFQRARKDMDAVRKQGRLDHDATSYLSTALGLLEKRDWLAGEDPDDKWIRQLFEL